MARLSASPGVGVSLSADGPRRLCFAQAARIMALAGAGEILVSEITMQLAGGSGLDFEDRGQVELRGVTGARRLFAVAPPKATVEAG